MAMGLGVGSSAQNDSSCPIDCEGSTPDRYHRRGLHSSVADIRGRPMIKGLLKRRTSAGFRRAIRNLMEEFRVQRLHRASLKRLSCFDRDNLKLHIGS